MPETTLSQITEHVFWMSPGQPDRPSLAAVVGKERTLMLDAGASAAHAHLFLDALHAAGVAGPHMVALTHWHWDHVFGAAARRAPVIASAATAARLAVLAGYDWSDAAHNQRVAAGEEIAMCADDIKVELPAPRNVLLPLLDALTAFDADFYVEGHGATVMSRADFDDQIGEVRRAYLAAPFPPAMRD